MNYVTKDISLAAILICSGRHLVNVDKSDKRRYKFFFEGGDFSKLEQSWMNRDLVINAADFVDAQRRIRDILHQDE